KFISYDSCPQRALTERDERFLIWEAKQNLSLTINKLSKYFRNPKGNAIAPSIVREYLGKYVYSAYVERN
ncbi:MAG: hypothetical protein MHMPM18_004471, partial [Marteilia pararefringens]